MKKLALTFGVIYLGVFILFSILDLKGDYLKERSLWLLERDYNNLLTQMDTVPNNVIEAMAGRFRHYANEHLQTRFAARAQLLLGKLYMFKKNYPAARQEYQRLRSVYDKNPEFIAQAQANIAKSYELEGKWNQAESIYNQLIQQYPLTPTGFYIPMHIAQYYKEHGQLNNAQRAYDKAVNFYQYQIQKYPDTIAAYNAYRLTMVAYFEQKDWNKAVDAAAAFMINFPSGKGLEQALEIINFTCVTQLHDIDKALGIYSNFMFKHPKHLINPILVDLIKSLKRLKSKP